MPSMTDGLMIGVILMGLAIMLGILVFDVVEYEIEGDDDGGDEG